MTWDSPCRDAVALLTALADESGHSSADDVVDAVMGGDDRDDLARLVSMARMSLGLMKVAALLTAELAVERGMAPRQVLSDLAVAQELAGH